MSTNVEAIARALHSAGIERAFGLPGGEVVLLIDACRRAGIAFSLVGHETSAAFMAEVTGQLTERPGVCIATLGPGAMNLSLGLANASLDRAPVLALTAQVPDAIERHFPHQRLPLTKIFGAYCKFSGTVDGRDTEGIATQCLDLATAAPPGPVHLAIPSDLASKDVQPGPSRVTVPVGTKISHPALDEMQAALAEAKRPLLVVGVGCSPRDIPALRAFVECTRIPFVVTPKAKGALPEDSPLFLGVVGGMAIDRVVMETVALADLVFGVGFDPVECDKAWYVGRRVANLSRYNTAEGDYAPLESIGDVDASLHTLADIGRLASWPKELLEERRRQLRPSPIRSDSALSPLETIEALREVLPRDSILACDVGSHKYYAGQFWKSYVFQTFFQSNGLSAMGYGVPAAIAAKLHFPSRPAVAVVGDGGMLMMLHNLVFLRQNRLPVIVVCFSDESLSLIRIAQQRRGLEPYGVDFPSPDFARVADGFGIRGTHVTTIDQLKQAVESALKANEPAVIDVPVNIHEYEVYC